MTPPPALSGAPCATCGTLRSGPFCAECGQPEVGRLTLRGIAARLGADALDLNRGLLFTFVEMCRRPGTVVRDYLAGRTVRYTNPLKYFLIVAAVTTFLYVRSGAAAETAAAVAESFAQGGAMRVEASAVLEFLSAYFSLILLGGIPSSALATRLVLRRDGFNYAEHLVLNTLVAAQQCVMLGVGLMGAGLLPGEMKGWAASTLTGLSLVYLAWTLRGLTGRSWPASLARAAAATLLAIAFFLAAAFLAGVVFGAAAAFAGL